MKLSEHITAHGITSLWNITHLDNLKSVLKHGILSRNAASRLLHFTDISDADAQSRRTPINNPVTGINLDPHDYVPLFFADNTPMLYVVSDDSRVVLLEISPEVSDTDGVHFSDANVASQYAQIYKDPTDLDQLDWSVIKSRRGAFWQNWKLIRSAEVLIPKQCPPSFIKAIHVQTNNDANINTVDTVRQILSQQLINTSIAVKGDLTPYGIIFDA
jgi:hypothetical protein